MYGLYSIIMESLLVPETLVRTQVQDPDGKCLKYCNRFTHLKRFGVKEIKKRTCITITETSQHS